MLLTRLTVVIILWQIQILSHYAVHLKLTQCYMAITPQVNSVHQEGTWSFSLKNKNKTAFQRQSIGGSSFFFFFWQDPVACGILVPRPGIEPVSTTELPGDPNLLVLREQPWLSICSPVCWWEVHWDRHSTEMLHDWKRTRQAKGKNSVLNSERVFSKVVWCLKRLRSKDTDCKAT